MCQKKPAAKDIVYCSVCDGFEPVNAVDLGRMPVIGAFYYRHMSGSFRRTPGNGVADEHDDFDAEANQMSLMERTRAPETDPMETVDSGEAHHAYDNNQYIAELQENIVGLHMQIAHAMHNGGV